MGVSPVRFVLLEKLHGRDAHATERQYHRTPLLFRHDSIICRFAGRGLYHTSVGGKMD